MGRTDRTVDRPPDELVDGLRDLPTAVIADVAGGGTIVDHEIKPVAPATTVGTALTVRTAPGDNLPIHEALTVASPGDVLVVDAGGDVETALWGELLSTSAAAHDLAGTVLDGATRDAAAIDELGYPVFARAVCPRPPVKADAGSIGVPVTCGGVEVSPGDVVVGDGDGVAVVDPAHAEAVADDAAAKLEREGELASRAADGEYLYDVLGLDEVVGDAEGKSDATTGDDDA